MSLPKLFIGIDPGKSGGIAYVVPDGTAWATKMPETDMDLWDELKGVTRDYSAFAYIERVSAMPKQGVSSTFTFGEGYGRLQMALTAAGIPYQRVTPGVWQKGMSCLTKGDKNVSKRRAQELFPHMKVTHAIADALLLAEWNRRVDMGQTTAPKPA
jgi:crossover junction endodeoxyribonuclease RuvC